MVVRKDGLERDQEKTERKDLETMNTDNAVGSYFYREKEEY